MIGTRTPVNTRALSADGNVSRSWPNTRNSGASTVREAVGAFVRIALGEPWESVGLPGPPNEVALGIGAYLLLRRDGPGPGRPRPRCPGRRVLALPRHATGRVFRDAQAALRDAGAPFPVWVYVVPVSQQTAAS